MESLVSTGLNAPGATGSGSEHFCRAVVSDGFATTSYRVGGCGAPVVLLCSGGGQPADGLLQALAARFRVFAPDLDGTAVSGRAFSAWLRGFLDGLGLSEVALVAGPEYGLAVLGYALLEFSGVERLVLLLRDATDPAAPAGAVRDQRGHAGRPLLVIRLDDAGAPSASEMALDVVRFLEGRAE